MPITYDDPAVAYDSSTVQYDGGGSVPVASRISTLFGRFRRKGKDYSQTDRRIQAERLRRKRKDEDVLLGLMLAADEEDE